jgi:2-oxoglutarate dehydrogenase E2 component (dihydrolipoamide succinyltransferase)
MPQLGETVSEGTITRWLHGQGDTVAADEPLVEIATDKVSMEVPTLRAGVLLEVLVKEGETVPVGAALAWLEVEGEDARATVAAEEGAAEPVAAEPVAAEPVAAEPVAAEPVAAEPVAAEPVAAEPVAADSANATPAARADLGERRPSPLIRRLLEEAGLTAADVTPSGPGGRITREDVSAAVAARLAAPSTPEPAPAPPKRNPGGDHTQPLSRVRAVIAERMVTSLHTSAQLTSVVEVDVTRIAQLRARGGSAAARGVKLSCLPFFARAAVEALEAQPDLNASVDTAAGTVTHHSAIHLAVAVDTERGLLAPVIRDAGRLSLVGIAMAIADVAARTRDGTITADELSGGTFTITNTGSRGALFDTPIINQPQVAILGTGAVVRRPVVVTDPDNGAEAIAIRSMAFLALTYDHRLIDGAAAAKFLVAVRKRLEEGRFSPDLGLSES